MFERFEKLTAGVSQIYKNIQKIKKTRMESLDLKGLHVMCIHYLSLNPDGLTATDLCGLCREDKAGISRSLSKLEQHDLIRYELADDQKKYRAKACLTKTGREYAERVNALILNAITEVSQGITDEERETFYHILFLISDNLARLCGQE